MTDLPAFVSSVLAGVVWNAANLWVLTRVLAAWISPKRSGRRALGWLLLKLSVLYPLAVLWLLRPGTSPMGFGIGFTVTLASGLAWVVLRAQRLVAHGR